MWWGRASLSVCPGDNLFSSGLVFYVNFNYFAWRLARLLCDNSCVCAFLYRASNRDLHENHEGMGAIFLSNTPFGSSPTGVKKDQAYHSLFFHLKVLKNCSGVRSHRFWERAKGANSHERSKCSWRLGVVPFSRKLCIRDFDGKCSKRSKSSFSSSVTAY